MDDVLGDFHRVSRISVVDRVVEHENPDRTRCGLAEDRVAGLQEHLDRVDAVAGVIVDRVATVILSAAPLT